MLKITCDRCERTEEFRLPVLFSARLPAKWTVQDTFAGIRLFCPECIAEAGVVMEEAREFGLDASKRYFEEHFKDKVPQGHHDMVRVSYAECKMPTDAPCRVNCKGLCIK